MLDPTLKVRRLAEVELMRARHEAQRIGRHILWTSVGVLVALLALAMFSLAVFFALANVYGEAGAALIVGAALTIIAAAVFVYRRYGEGRAGRLEAQYLKMSVENARREVQLELELIERRVDTLSSGFRDLVRGSASGLQAVTLALGAITAVSPMLWRLVLSLFPKKK